MATITEDIPDIDDILISVSEEMRLQVARMIRRMRSAIPLRELVRHLQQGGTQTVISLLADIATSSLQVAMDTAVLRGTEAIHNAVGAAIRPDLRTGSVDPNFLDLTVLRRQRAHREMIVRRFNDSTADLIRSIARQGANEGLSALQMARRIRSSIGITAAQFQEVENFRRNLAVGPRSLPSQRYEDYSLRDTGFDEVIRQSRIRRQGLTPQQIDTITEEYAIGRAAGRTLVIGDTETLRAVNEGRDLAVEAYAGAGIITSYSKEWITAADERVRSHHSVLNGDTAAGSEPFVDGQGNTLRFPGDPLAPAGTVVNCRCLLRYVFEVPDGFIREDNPA